MLMDLNNPPEDDDSPLLIMLCKDNKTISQVSCADRKVKLPEALDIKEISPAAVFPLSNLPRIHFHAAGQNQFQMDEWLKFVNYIQKRDKYGRHEFLITPPVDKTPAHFNCLSVAYRLKKSLRDGEVLDSAASADVRVKEPVVRGDAGCMPQHVQSYSQPLETDIKSEDSRRSRMITEDAFHGPQNSQSLRTRPVKGDVICGASKECLEDNLQPERTVSLHRVSEDVRRSAQSTVWPEKRTNEEQAALHKHINPTQAESKFILPGVDQEAVLYSPRREVKQESSNAGRVRPSLARTHPSYLETLGQNHAGWIFGAIAELIDNSRDASASRLDISIELEYYKRAGKRIPVLFMVDNGCGMSHSDIVRMLSFGHKRPEQENKDLIGRFGVGFKVPLDYSLHAYLEVIFRDPRMKIYVQGTMVKTRPLAKSLNKTKVIKDVLMDKNVELTLGRSQEERERGNCGIFLYWHGRLIEAYKRVGGMVHNTDMGRGVIGVLDVTELMSDGNGCVWVLNNKQGFQDCEAYAKLEQWLGSKADEYWDENFDTLELRDNNKGYKPDYDWVQCNKCRKWRILDPSFNSENLPDDWFCYMPPFKGSCSIPEEKVEPGIITVGAKRSTGGFITARHLQPVKEEGNETPVHDSIVMNSRGESEASTESEDEIELPVVKRTFKRLKRGPPASRSVKGGHQKVRRREEIDRCWKAKQVH